VITLPSDKRFGLVYKVHSAEGEKKIRQKEGTLVRWFHRRLWEWATKEPGYDSWQEQEIFVFVTGPRAHPDCHLVGAGMKRLGSESLASCL
jgi:hypothetical protein